MKNLFDFSVVPKKGEELFEELFVNEKIRVEKIFSNELKNGQWYDQEGDELVFLLQGKATLEYEDRKKDLLAGDIEFIPSGVKHRVF